MGEKEANSVKAGSQPAETDLQLTVEGTEESVEPDESGETLEEGEPGEEVGEEEGEETVEEEGEEEGEEEKPSDGKGKGQISNLNKALSQTRQALKQLQDTNQFLFMRLQQLEGGQSKPQEQQETIPKHEPGEWLTAGQIQELIQAHMRSAQPPDNSASMRVELMNLSENLARVDKERFPDYDAVIADTKRELIMNPSHPMSKYIIGDPGTWISAAERLYQFALMKGAKPRQQKAPPSANRKQTIQQIVKQKQRPATMKSKGEGSPSGKISIENLTVESAMKLPPGTLRKIWEK